MTPVDSVLSVWEHFVWAVVDLYGIELMFVSFHFISFPFRMFIDLLVSDALDFCTFVCTCRQFNHSDKVILLSLFTSQYRGIFLPHFFKTLQIKRWMSWLKKKFRDKKCRSTNKNHANLAAVTSSLNIFHSFRS